MAFCRYITEGAGVTAISVSAFYDAPDAPTHCARRAFGKQPEVLDEAIARFKTLFGGGVERAEYLRGRLRHFH